MKKKTLVMLLSSLLVITTAAFGTIAYLTDRSAVTNRFTIGNVSIDVDESVVTPEGEPVDSDNDGETDRTTEVDGKEGNTYHLMPGKTYTKDPTLTVKKGSEESYVRMLVTITHIDRLQSVFGSDFLPEQYVTGWDPDIWQCVGVTPGTETITDPATQQESIIQTAEYEFRYHITVAGVDENGESADNRLPALFTSFTIPGEVTGDQLVQLQPVEIRVEGQAIQKEGFETPDLAWAEFPISVNTPQDQQGDNAAGE